VTKNTDDKSQEGAEPSKKKKKKNGENVRKAV
jgi:hypothetical protein